MRKWHKSESKLAANHGWRAAPGNKICVLDRGDFQFEYPQGWHVKPEDGTIKVTDKPTPNDDCVLQVSLMRFPPLKDSRPSLAMLLQESVMHEGLMIESDRIHSHSRKDIDVVWGEFSKDDPVEHREAIWRHAFCHTKTQRGHLYAFVKFGFWPEDRERVNPVWDHFLDSCIMDRPVADPTKGPQFH